MSPTRGKTLGEIGAIQNIEKLKAGVKVTLELGFPLSGYEETLRKNIFSVLEKMAVDPIKIDITSKITARAAQRASQL